MTALYAIWCGVCWVLRGGKLGAIVRGIGLPEPGTTATRIVCAGLMTAPLMPLIDWLALPLWVSIYAATTIGYFDRVPAARTKTHSRPLCSTTSSRLRGVSCG